MPRETGIAHRLPEAEAGLTARRFEASGRGWLAISRHFCRLTDGDLTVESVYGKGSTVTIRLPLVVQDA